MELFRSSLLLLPLLSSNLGWRDKGENTVETQVPMYVIEGQSVHMYCIFTHKSFYTLKWFMNDTEIYRLTPEAYQRENQRMIFNQKMVQVLAKGWKGLYGWKGAGSDREVMKGNLDIVLVGMLMKLYSTE
ncbi:uncharacterized protein LOC111707330 [Eurytemora carolleeae]|uniref:uncharacterized protein LOC111707330 n=1 Tax=Eurytemora carolleeae TaxID=1294199 RepID=UPI000C75BF00|nr:uncharacterized protein LOC111707330 [Eurytemora carolleeae]|eukprot:XP_023336185.1 uncharacterized protein LOC111707330 [Eurytemora affinis]